MDNDLFSSLRKYRPRENKDSLENFTSEAFAWLLRNYRGFSEFFLKKLNEKLQTDFDLTDHRWETQKNFGGVYPDMVCEVGSWAFVFENKAWAKLHDGQLKNYRSFAGEKYNEKYKLILITALSSQQAQNPDLSLLWSHIYTWIKEWLRKNEVNETDSALFNSFINLLDEEGMGPAEPISESAIRYHLQARNFLKTTQSLFSRLLNKDNATESEKKLIDSEDCDPFIRNAWGRIGIEFFRNWRPGIFAGILQDWEDHNAKPLKGDESPDFAVIIDFDKDILEDYKKVKAYDDLKDELKKIAESAGEGWEFYDHLSDNKIGEKEKNDFHPLYIRRPMLEVFKGADTAELQEQEVMNCIREIVPRIVKSESFRKLREKYNPSISSSH